LHEEGYGGDGVIVLNEVVEIGVGFSADVGESADFFPVAGGRRVSCCRS
jgi:hypothetical protein